LGGRQAALLNLDVGGDVLRIELAAADGESADNDGT